MAAVGLLGVVGGVVLFFDVVRIPVPEGDHHGPGYLILGALAVAGIGAVTALAGIGAYILGSRANPGPPTRRRTLGQAASLGIGGGVLLGLVFVSLPILIPWSPLTHLGILIPFTAGFVIGSVETIRRLHFRRRDRNA